MDSQCKRSSWSLRVRPSLLGVRGGGRRGAFLGTMARCRMPLGHLAGLSGAGQGQHCSGPRCRTGARPDQPWSCTSPGQPQNCLRPGQDLPAAVLPSPTWRQHWPGQPRSLLLPSLCRVAVARLYSARHTCRHASMNEVMPAQAGVIQGEGIQGRGVAGDPQQEGRGAHVRDRDERWAFNVWVGRGTERMAAGRSKLGRWTTELVG